MKTRAEREYIIDITNVMSLLNTALNTLDENADDHSDFKFDTLRDSVQTALVQCERLLKESL